MNRERRSPPTSPNIAHASLRVPDLFVGEPGLDRVKSCHCGSSRNRLAGFRETGRAGPTVSEWVRRGVVDDGDLATVIVLQPEPRQRTFRVRDPGGISYRC